MAIAKKKWFGKCVWIIGASFGIGRSLAQILAKEGAQLILSGRTEKALVELQSSLFNKNHRVCALDVCS